MNPAVNRAHRIRFFRASGAIITLALAAMGAILMYKTVRAPVMSTGNFLLGALACSAALVLFFVIVQPGAKN